MIAALALPSIIDVDKFRPQITQAVNDKINGELKLGKLHLSLWTGIDVSVDSVSLHINGQPKPVVESDKAYLEIPFWSLLTFSPRVTAVLIAPKVDVVKGKDAKLNIMALVKEGTPAQPSKPAQAASSSGLPAIVANASAGLRVKKGYLSFADEASGAKYVVDGFDVDVENLGLRRTVDASITLPLKVNTADMQVEGPVIAHAKITPDMSDAGDFSASGTAEVDASEMSFSLSKGMVKKSAKTTLTVSADFSGSQKEADLKKISLHFDKIGVDANGKIILQPKMITKMNVQTSGVDLASLEKFVPMLHEYALAGTARFQVKTDGPMEALTYSGQLEVSGGKAAYPAMLKAPISFGLQTKFSEKSLNLESVTVNGPSTDVLLKGSVENFKAPKFGFKLISKEINVDALMKSSDAKKTAEYFIPSLIPQAEAAPGHGKDKKKAPAHNAKGASVKATHAESDPAPAGNTGNPMLSLAKNPILENAAGTFNIAIGKVIAKGGTITDINANISLKNLALAVENASLKTCEGAVNAKFDANLKSPGLDFATSGTMKGLSAKAALTSYVPKFQNSLEGKLGANWNLKGRVYPQSAMMKALGGTMNLTAENGKLSTIDLKESIQGVMAKLPLLKGVSPPNIDQNFKSMRADMKFANGVITANPVEVVGTEKGVNLKGKSTIQEDLTQDTYVDVYDPNRLLPKEISNGKDVAMALHITGSVKNPQTDYGYTVGKLAKNVVKNQGADLINKALGNAGGDKGKEAVKGILKGLGF